MNMSSIYSESGIESIVFFFRLRKKTVLKFIFKQKPFKKNPVYELIPKMIYF